MFIKSILRRAIAKFELGRFADATFDLRSFLKFEPKNPRAADLMRQMFEPVLMSEIISSTVVGHYLRRALTKFYDSSNPYMATQLNIRTSLLRFTVTF
jgi:hypothetical protein